MGRKLKTNGYVARQQLNAIERAGVTANRVLEQLLTAESVQVRAVLVAQAAISINKINSATSALKAIWLVEDADGTGDSD